MNIKLHLKTRIANKIVVLLPNRGKQHAHYLFIRKKNYFIPSRAFHFINTIANVKHT